MGIARYGRERRTMAFQKVSPVQSNNNEVVDIAESKGQVTEGIYLRSRDIPFGTKDDGSPDIRTIVDMQGPLGEEDVYSFWASTSIKMTLPQIAAGSRIRLTYLGKQKNPKTNRTFKSFDIEVDDGVDEAPKRARKGNELPV